MSAFHRPLYKRPGCKSRLRLTANSHQLASTLSCLKFWCKSTRVFARLTGHESCMRVVDQFWTASGFYFVATGSTKWPKLLSVFLVNFRSTLIDSHATLVLVWPSNHASPCKLLFANSYLPTLICQLLFANSYLPTLICQLLFANSYLPTLICQLLFANSYLPTCINSHPRLTGLKTSFSSVFVWTRLENITAENARKRYCVRIAGLIWINLDSASSEAKKMADFRIWLEIWSTKMAAS